MTATVLDRPHVSGDVLWEGANGRWCVLYASAETVVIFDRHTGAREYVSRTPSGFSHPHAVPEYVLASARKALLRIGVYDYAAL